MIQITVHLPKQLLVLNHSSKSPELEKTSGSKKFNKAHNSWRLFCKGVPVKSSLFLVLISLTIKLSLDSSFLILKIINIQKKI